MSGTPRRRVLRGTELDALMVSVAGCMARCEAVLRAAGARKVGPDEWVLDIDESRASASK
jgi:hypothetical protein